MSRSKCGLFLTIWTIDPNAVRIFRERIRALTRRRLFDVKIDLHAFNTHDVGVDGCFFVGVCRVLVGRRLL